MQLNEFKPGVIQPGMERIVEAGETLEITDDKGQVFAVTGTDARATIEFIVKFDHWRTMTKTLLDGPVVNMAWKEVENAFYNLPMRVQRQLSSFKTLGVKA